MTQTPRRSGIRLPWSHDEDADEEPAEVETTTTETEAAATGTDAPATETAAAKPAQPDAVEPTATESAEPGLVGREDVAPAPMSEEDNALLASLISAMREVADRERDASVTSLKTAVDEAIDQLRSRSAEEAEQLRSKADLDITGFTDWVRTETERIEAEGRARTESRREQLTQQLEDHEKESQRKVEEMESRVADYERELAAFFTQLHDIRDPAVFGTAAKRMPRPPELGTPEPGTPEPAAEAGDAEVTATAEAVVEEAPADVETAVVEESTVDSGTPVVDETSAVDEPAGAFAAEQTASADTASAAEESAPAAAVGTIEEAVSTDVSDAATEATAQTAETEPTDDADEFETQTPTTPSAETAAETLRQRMDALGIPEAPAGETTATAETPEAGAEEPARDAMGLAERLAQLDARIGEAAPSEVPEAPEASEAPVATAAAPGLGGEVATAIMVSGLGSFGAITSFKQALERVEGVHGISLSLGPTGEFVYRATHDADFDLVTAIGTIENGTAQVERQADGSLRVAVQRGR